MALIDRWRPAQGSGRIVVWALPLVAAATMWTHVAHSFDGSLTTLSTESGSTLAGRISSQDLDLQKTVVDLVDSGILLGIKQTAPIKAAPTKAESQGLELRAPRQSVAAKPLKKPLKSSVASVTDRGPTQHKWVKPKLTSAKNLAAKLSAESGTVAAPSQAAPVPQVARLLPKPRAKKLTRVTPKRQATPLSKNTASKKVASKNTTPKLARAATAPNKTPESLPAVTLTPEFEPTPSTSTPRNLPPLTKSQIALRSKIRRVLTHYYNRPLNTRDRSPWELMHAMLAYEAHSRVLQGGPKGEPITAVGWLTFNQACKRRTLMYVGDEGDLRVRVGPALQGHRGQLLSMLAQSRINSNYPMLVEGHELKVADLIEMEKRTCYPRTELTFKLIGLMHYLDSDATWMNDQGMEWDIPRLIAEEIRQPVRGAACGGTHRLSGLTLAYKTREKRGEPIDGQYLKAKQFVTRYQQYAYRLQNRDGSFSTEWFRGPGNENSLDRKFKTTGHILEWLLYAADQKQLHHWRTTKAVNFLATIMQRNGYKDWETGPMGHAIHALLVYDRLVFAPYDATEQSSIASKPTLPWQKTQQKR